MLSHRVLPFVVTRTHPRAHQSRDILLQMANDMQVLACVRPRHLRLVAEIVRLLAAPARATIADEYRTADQNRKGHLP
jgi:hypothetical protein